VSSCPPSPRPRRKLIVPPAVAHDRHNFRDALSSAVAARETGGAGSGPAASDHEG
jgi:hypothetical protein